MMRPKDLKRKRDENIVLIADDDMFMRTMVKKGIMDLCTVYEVADGLDVIEQYKKHLPDVLLLDIHMPGKKGPDILLDIFAFDPEAFVIMLSADSIEGNIRECVDRGAKGFICKPFNRDTLVRYMTKCDTIRFSDHSVKETTAVLHNPVPPGSGTPAGTPLQS